MKKCNKFIYFVDKERGVGIRSTGARIDGSCHASERTELRGLRRRFQDSRVAVGRCMEKAGQPHSCCKMHRSENNWRVATGVGAAPGRGGMDESLKSVRIMIFWNERNSSHLEGPGVLTYSSDRRCGLRIASLLGYGNRLLNGVRWT